MSVRWSAWIALLVAEVLVLSLGFDTGALDGDRRWWAELLQLLQDTEGHGHRVEHLDGRHRCLGWLHIRLNHYSANPQRKRQGALIKS